MKKAAIYGTVLSCLLGGLAAYCTRDILSSGPSRSVERVFSEDREAARGASILHDDDWARVHSCSPWKTLSPNVIVWFDLPGPDPLVLWCLDDDGSIVPLRPDLVRRGRILRFPFGWVPW